MVISTLVAGWSWSVVHARELAVPAGGPGPRTPMLASALTMSGAPTTAYLTDAALEAVTDRILRPARGASGKLRATIQPAPTPLRSDSLPPGARIEYSRGG